MGKQGEKARNFDVLPTQAPRVRETARTKFCKRSVAGNKPAQGSAFCGFTAQ